MAKIGHVIEHEESRSESQQQSEEKKSIKKMRYNVEKNSEMCRMQGCKKKKRIGVVVVWYSILTELKMYIFSKQSHQLLS